MLRRLLRFMGSGIICTVVISLLAGWSAVEYSARAGSVNSDDPKVIREGRRVYLLNSASCHGTNLEGQPDWDLQLPSGAYPAPPHDASGHTWHHPDDELIAMTKFGGAEYSREGVKSNMPSFRDTLEDREIRAIISYIKSRWPEEILKAQEVITRRAR